MTMTSCKCGQTVQFPPGATGNFACPNCGQLLILPASSHAAPPVKGPAQPAYAPAGPAYAPVQENNSDAVLGFALAMISFFTCLLAAPFAVYYSMRGMGKRDNQGMAVAGLIIGIMQSIGLVIGIIYVIIAFLFLGGLGIWGFSEIAKAHEQQVERRDRVAQAQTTDVVTAKRNSSKIETVSEALNQLKNQHAFDRQQALSFLAKADPVDADRNAVLKATLPLTEDFFNSTDACKVVEKWMDAPHVDQLEQHLQQSAGTRNSRSITLLLPVLAKLNKEKLIPFIMNQDRNVAEKAIKLARDAGVDDETLAKQFINALKLPSQKNENRDRHQLAIRMLKTIEPIESLKSALNKNLVEGLKGTPHVHIRAYDELALLNKWGITEDSLDLVAKAGNFELLLTVESEKTLQLLEEAFQNIAKTRSASQALEKIGPAAESRVWSALSNTPTRMEALRLLEKIGTSNSIPHLEKLFDSPATERMARRTIAKIEQANRKPTTEWQN